MYPLRQQIDVLPLALAGAADCAPQDVHCNKPALQQETSLEFLLV
jgi:hypothetical protein